MAPLDNTDVTCSGHFERTLALDDLECIDLGFGKGPRTIRLLRQGASIKGSDEFGGATHTYSLRSSIGATATTTAILMFLRKCPDAAQEYEFDSWDPIGGAFYPMTVRVRGHAVLDLGTQTREALIVDLEEHDQAPQVVYLDLDDRRFLALFHGTSLRCVREGMLPAVDVRASGVRRVQGLNAALAFIKTAASGGDATLLSEIVDFRAQEAEATQRGEVFVRRAAEERLREKLHAIWGADKVSFGKSGALEAVVEQELEFASVHALDNERCALRFSTSSRFKGLEILLHSRPDGTWRVLDWSRLR